MKKNFISEADKRIVQMQPHNTPLDQITRYGQQVKTDSMIVNYKQESGSKEQYCQKFTYSIENPIPHNLHIPESEFLELEEGMILLMRKEMEKTFLFGTKGKNYTNNFYTYTTDGIWRQTDMKFVYNTPFTEKILQELALLSFHGCEKGKRKYLLAGSGLLNSLSNIELNTQQSHYFTEVNDMGLSFKKMNFNDGDIFVIFENAFDLFSQKNNGIIIDAEDITKVTLNPFKREIHNLMEIHEKNSKRHVFKETSCLYLTKPKAHIRIQFQE